jgi:hypothetical protein
MACTLLNLPIGYYSVSDNKGLLLIRWVLQVGIIRGACCGNWKCHQKSECFGGEFYMDTCQLSIPSINDTLKGSRTVTFVEHQRILSDTSY